MAAKLTTRGTISLQNGVVNYLFRRSTKYAVESVSSALSPQISHIPPVVLIGGTAQTINSLLGHHGHLANNSNYGLLHYELRGQGRTTTLPLDDCSLKRHVEDFDAVLESNEEFTDRNGQVDLCGFSFGGRVALAIAAERPEKVRRIVCTGVPSNRGATGRIILQSWLKSLSRGDLEEFLWQSMSDGHSQTFLNRHESRLYGWVKAAAESNRTEAIKGLVGQTHTDDLNDPWHTVNLANRALKGGLGEEDALFLVGDQDRLATVEQCNALAELGGWRCETIYGSGHALPIEQPVKWRSAVMAHFASN